MKLTYWEVSFVYFFLITSYWLLWCNYLSFSRVSTRRAEAHQELEKKLEASEKARKDAEAKAASANELQAKLDVVDVALKDKTEQIAQREADIIKRLKILSTFILPFPLWIFCYSHACTDNLPSF
jgi:chlorite dismutase